MTSPALFSTKEMSIINLLVGFHIIVIIIIGKDDISSSVSVLQTLPDHVQDQDNSSVKSKKVFILKDGVYGVRCQRLFERHRKRSGALLEGEKHG